MNPATAGCTAAAMFRIATAAFPKIVENCPACPATTIAPAIDAPNNPAADAISTSPARKSGSACDVTSRMANAIPVNSSCCTACCIADHAGATSRNAVAASRAAGDSFCSASANLPGSSMFLIASPNPRKPTTRVANAPAAPTATAGTSARPPASGASDPASDRTDGTAATAAAASPTIAFVRRSRPPPPPPPGMSNPDSADRSFAIDAPSESVSTSTGTRTLFAVAIPCSCAIDARSCAFCAAAISASIGTFSFMASICACTARTCATDSRRSRSPSAVNGTSIWRARAAACRSRSAFTRNASESGSTGTRTAAGFGSRGGPVGSSYRTGTSTRSFSAAAFTRARSCVTPSKSSETGISTRS